jgi:hypothetical protein
MAVPLLLLKSGRGTRAVSPCTLFASLRPPLAGRAPGVKFLLRDLPLGEQEFVVTRPGIVACDPA